MLKEKWHIHKQQLDMPELASLPQDLAICQIMEWNYCLVYYFFLFLIASGEVNSCMHFAHNFNFQVSWYYG
jgi:hypothetical protein